MASVSSHYDEDGRLGEEAQELQVGKEQPLRLLQEGGKKRVAKYQAGQVLRQRPATSLKGRSVTAAAGGGGGGAGA